MSEKEINIEGQAGPQTEFLETDADIAIYGGAAGGGKTYGILLDFLRHYENADAGAVCFRRTSPQIHNEGGLWDTASKLYPLVGAEDRIGKSTWIFPSGAKIKFAHLQYESNVHDYQGAQIPVIYFDELTHFTKKQFFYMLSRNRTTSGIKPYIRATTNPDSSSWVREFIDWWIDDDGFPIPERGGVLRWFYRIDDRMYWDDDKDNLKNRFPELAEIADPKSVTFIPSKLSDNKILMETDPSYLANLLAQSKVERERLLDGNWDVEAAAGEVFHRGWFEEVEAHPPLTHVVRCWDRAATEWEEGDEKARPDATASVKLGKDADGFFYILDVEQVRYSAHKVETLIKNTAKQDGVSVTVKGFQDPGSAGKNEAENFVRMLAGFDVTVERISTDKVTAARPASAQAEALNIKILKNCRNKEAFYEEAHNFPDGAHDDIVDALSGAFNHICSDDVGTWTKDMSEYEEETSLIDHGVFDRY